MEKNFISNKSNENKPTPVVLSLSLHIASSLDNVGLNHCGTILNWRKNVLKKHCRDLQRDPNFWYIWSNEKSFIGTLKQSLKVFESSSKFKQIVAVLLTCPKYV